MLFAQYLRACSVIITQGGAVSINVFDMENEAMCKKAKWKAESAPQAENIDADI